MCSDGASGTSNRFQVSRALVITLVGLLLMEGLLQALWYAVREKRIEIPAPTQDPAS